MCDCVVDESQLWTEWGDKSLDIATKHECIMHFMVHRMEKNENTELCTPVHVSVGIMCEV